MSETRDQASLLAELQYYHDQVDRLSGENLKLDYLRSELRHELKQKRQAFALFVELQQSLLANREIARVFDGAARAVNATLSMDRTLVLQPTDRPNEYQPAQWIGYRDDMAPRLDAARFTFPATFAAGTGRLLANGTADRTPLVDELRQVLDLPFFICVPVPGEAAPLGLFVTGRLREAKPLFPPLDAGDLDTLLALANFIASGVRNHRIGVLESRLAEQDARLRVASRIQNELLPKTSPVIDGYALAGRTVPAQLVGGDYYDFIRVDERRLAICLGDVAGKGLPAALLMANLQATIRGQALWNPSACDCLQRSNRLLFLSTDEGKYATMCYGVLNTRGHYFSYANAGHNPPLLVTRDGCSRLTTGGTVVGLFEASTFEEDVVHLEPGDILVLFSDGITEAVDAGDTEFGDDQLLAVVMSAREASAETLADAIISAVMRHAHGMPQADDMTVVVLKRDA